MQTNRRRFLSLLGVGAASAPLAAKAVSDGAIARQAGLNSVAGFTSGGMGLGSPAGEPIGAAAMAKGFAAHVPYELRVIKAADYIKAFGVPKHVEATLRDQAKWLNGLDPDIACKQSWSMSVKIMTQRERNYERAVERMKVTGWQQRKREGLSKLLGFEWPF